MSFIVFALFGPNDVVFVVSSSLASVVVWGFRACTCAVSFARSGDARPLVRSQAMSL